MKSWDAAGPPSLSPTASGRPLAAVACTGAWEHELAAATAALTFQSAAAVGGAGAELPATSGRLAERVAVGTIFCVLFAVGLVGNGGVIKIVLSQRRMRRPVVNRYLLSIALADVAISCLGLPEMVVFLMDRGWPLGEGVCKANRYLLVGLLYAAIISLTAVCIERYVAVLYPFRAHFLRSRRRIPFVIAAIWVGSFVAAIPTAIFVTVRHPAGGASHSYCVLQFAEDETEHAGYYAAYKYTEFALLYLLPLALQATTFALMARRLCRSCNGGGAALDIESSASPPQAPSRSPPCDGGVLARRPTSKPEGAARVVHEQRDSAIRMLATCLSVYVLSYTPSQVLLVYRSASGTSFEDTWSFRAFAITLMFVHSSANPALYYAFNRSFRRQMNRLYACRR